MTDRETSEALHAYQRAQICAIIAVGCSRANAANYVGCSVGAIERLAVRSKTFARQLAEAESKHELAHLENIRAAGKKEWRASAWALERRYPERYAARKPKFLTPAQVSKVLSEFASVVLDAHSDAAQRERVQARLSEISSEIEQLLEHKA